MEEAGFAACAGIALISVVADCDSADCAGADCEGEYTEIPDEPLAASCPEAAEVACAAQVEWMRTEAHTAPGIARLNTLLAKTVTIKRFIMRLLKDAQLMAGWAGLCALFITFAYVFCSVRSAASGPATSGPFSS